MLSGEDKTVIKEVSLKYDELDNEICETFNQTKESYFKEDLIITTVKITNPEENKDKSILAVIKTKDPDDNMPF